MSEPALKKCPQCKKSKLRRVFGTGAAILFKGSGFYETDYRSESYKSAAKADQEAGSKPAGDAKGATDTKGTSGTNGAASTDSGGKAKKRDSKSSKS